MEVPKAEMEKSVEFKAKTIKLQIQFEVQPGVHEPRQNLHAKGGGLMDLGSELKTVGEIAMWGAKNKLWVMKKFKQSGFKNMPNTSPRSAVSDDAIQRRINVS